MPERPHWRQLAQDLGFLFHTIHGDPYWDESAYYRFTLRQIEDHIEDPTQELHRMCLDLVAEVVAREELLEKLHLPRRFWDFIASSWQRRDGALYGRMDLVYDGVRPAKLLEYNADTPTSLYETAFFQWVWLEQQIEAGVLSRDADQYNALQEHLVDAFAAEDKQVLHFAAQSGSEEDRATVRYLQDCAAQAGHETRFLHVEQIGVDPGGRYTNLQDEVILWLFKLYPWEWMLGDDFAAFLGQSGCRFVEPPWKAVISNKGFLALLWDRFKGHPNLLPCYFERDQPGLTGSYARKPLFSREGGNVTLVANEEVLETVPGPYGAEGYIRQQLCPLPVFGSNHTVIGSWVIGGRACGIGIREDCGPVTKDTSRFLPHVIFD